MRTKSVEQVLRCDLIAESPRVEVYLEYDGLAGMTLRSWLYDIVHALEEQGTEVRSRFLSAIRKVHSGYVDICFRDYVSYGIGGGDATADFHFGRYLILHMPATEGVPEHLWLKGRGKDERGSIREME
ncbi:MAG: hypothetical protein ACREB9_07720 [Thermoplasmata archaeon]